VRPVNLLPAKHRPRTATGQRQGSSYYVLAGLGVVLIAVVAYVLTLNSINTKRDEVTKANTQAQQDGARATQLSAYGNFAQVKQQRVDSIKQLAQSRIDWELLAREIAQITPDGVWMKTINANSGDGNGSQTAGGASSSSSNSASGQPTVQFEGCAASQDQVATLLVRLKQLHGAQDVSVEKSDRPDSGGGATGSTVSSSSSGNTCGTTNRQLNYEFTVDLTLKPDLAQGDANAKVPNTLGGGS
jgi:Tfp pilus assembly protein PilN